MLSDYSDYVIGLATFDLNGLPKQHFVTSSDNDGAWIQVIFQTLCLKSLLACSLKLEGLTHITIQGSQNDILIVKQELRYVGLLLQKATPQEILVSVLENSLNL
ncbi:MAG: hypothetical protein SFW36_16260 [Leptolyngbyaceae cyanobacterium bins.59]|nr:hypothetical protein [Leptolyngbyaceae cyanobacterium bins.59]